MMSIFGFTDSHPHVLKIVLSYCDIDSLIALDHCRLTSKAVCDKFVEKIFKGLRIPALCDHLYTTAEPGVYPAQLRWSIERQVDLEGFTLTIPGYKSALFWAVDMGHADLCNLILSKGSKSMASVSTPEHAQTAPLHQAVYRQRRDIILILLKHGADVNARDSSYYTPLQGACSEAHSASKAYDLASLLLDGGASIDLKPDAGGQTVLHWEAAKGRVKLVELLIDRGADLDAVCELGRTPLHYAVGQNHPQVVARLVTGGANVDLVNGNGRSALIIAAKNGRREIARLLVESGADLEVIDWDRKSVFDYVKGFRGWDFLDSTPPAAVA